MSNVSKEYVENLKKESDDRDFNKMGVTLPKGWRFVEYDEKTDQMIIKRTKNMASLKWEEGGQLSGFYVSAFGEVLDTGEEDSSAGYNRDEKGVNIFKTSKQAYASNALAMLSQQLDRANEGWKPDWSSDEHRYSICSPNVGNKEHSVFRDTHYYKFLVFKSKEVAEEFLKTNIDLIKQASVFLN